MRLHVKQEARSERGARARRSFVAALALAAAAVSCEPPPRRADATLALEACRVPGSAIPALCGTYQVFEDRQARAGRTIELSIVVVPARERAKKADPVFFLAGGPGQSATMAARLVLATALDPVRRDRDIVFVDARGTGGSGRLACELGGDLLADILRPTFPVERVRACRAALESADGDGPADLTKYVTPIAADDLDDVRAALGYETINLVGGSYGTRAALVYMRKYGERVRSAVLDGNAPTTMTLFLDFYADTQRALDLLLSDCAADPTCNAAYPDLARDLHEVLERLRVEPAKVRVRHPRTGAMEDVVVEAVTFASGLRGLLYSADLARLVPLTIRRAKEGDFAPFAAQVEVLVGQLEQMMSVPLFLSVACAEDVARIDDAAADAATAKAFLPASVLGEMRAICAEWPRATLPAGYHDPVSSSVPSLVLSGRLDPATPPRWGEAVVQHLSNGRHVIARGAGHGVLGHGCAPRLVADFIDRADASGIDVACLEDEPPRAPFFTSESGPPP